MALGLELLGQRFGRLTVVLEAGRDSHGCKLWHCLCDCDTGIVTTSNALTSGHTTSCGCLQKERAAKNIRVYNRGRRQDLMGQRFGKLVVIAKMGKNKRQRCLWKCRCDCGGTIILDTGSLTTGNTQSCGCLRPARHGMSKTRIYITWCSMMSRCYNPRTSSYKNYGGRGIEVCERWHNFVNFYADMGDRPSPQHSLERIDNDGDYEPSNCKWATKEEQNNNTRNNHLITFNGETKTITRWSREVGISNEAMRRRLEKWSLERALITPNMQKAHKMS